MSICEACGVFEPIAVVKDFSKKTSSCEMCGKKFVNHAKSEGDRK